MSTLAQEFNGSCTGLALREGVQQDASTESTRLEGAAIPEFLSLSGWFSLSSAGAVR